MIAAARWSTADLPTVAPIRMIDDNRPIGIVTMIGLSRISCQSTTQPAPRHSATPSAISIHDARFGYAAVAGKAGTRISGSRYSAGSPATTIATVITSIETADSTSSAVSPPRI